MEGKSRPELLTAFFFLIGLFCLLLNDLFLKCEFSNTLTGKLSDFAGLFIFPYFFSAYRPKQAKVYYWATATLFIVWKSPLSQGFINFFNNLGIGLHRTVDYSDLWALFILPFSFYYFIYRIKIPLYRRKPLIVMLSVVSIFSFCATTVGGKKVDAPVETDRTFVLDISKWDLLNNLSVEVFPDGTYHYPTQEDLADSLFYLYFYIPEVDASVTAQAVIQELDSNKTVIHLDCIVSGIVRKEMNHVNKFKALEAKDFEQSFETYFIKQINNHSSEKPLSFHNKRILDNYKNNK